MTFEEYFGKECADSIRELLSYALSSDEDERSILENVLREDANSQHSAVVRRVLFDLANLIKNIKKEPTSVAAEVSHNIN